MASPNGGPPESFADFDDNLDYLLGNSGMQIDMTALSVDSHSSEPHGHGPLSSASTASSAPGSSPAPSQNEILAWLATHPLGLEPLFSVDPNTLMNAYQQQQQMLMQLQWQQHAQQAQLQALQHMHQSRPSMPYSGQLPIGSVLPTSHLQNMPRPVMRPPIARPPAPNGVGLSQLLSSASTGSIMPTVPQPSVYMVPTGSMPALPIGANFAFSAQAKTSTAPIPIHTGGRRASAPLDSLPKGSFDSKMLLRSPAASVQSGDESFSMGSPHSKDVDMDGESAVAKRNAHSVAEAKRRGNIKNGFQELQQIVPNCKKGENEGRFSKAMVLRKAVEYIACLVRDRTSLLSEVTKMREEVQRLRKIIDEYEKLGGAGEIEARAKLFAVKAKENENVPGVYDAENIKFFVFCSVMERLWETFNDMVSLEDPDIFSKTLIQWFEQFCAPDALRGIFLTSLQSLGSAVFAAESQEKIRRWGGALSACKDLMVTSLDSSRVPGAKVLGQTLDMAAGYLGAPESLKSVTAPAASTSPPQAVQES